MIAGIYRHDSSYEPFLFGWWLAEDEAHPICDTNDAVTVEEAVADILLSANGAPLEFKFGTDVREIATVSP